MNTGIFPFGFQFLLPITATILKRAVLEEEGCTGIDQRTGTISAPTPRMVTTATPAQAPVK